MDYRRYDSEIDMNMDSAHTRVVRLVGKNKKVLEVGCASGYMSRVLVEQFGCDVTGIEVDPEAAKMAREICSRVITGDLETLDIRRELAEDRFDVIICADVLEHLREPVRALSSLRPFLHPEGYVVASIPNIAHLSVVVDLILGRFTYRPLGLLDETHLRFFTRHSIVDCFDRAGFVITKLERIVLEPEKTEFRTILGDLPAELVEFLQAQDDSNTYQFVLCACDSKNDTGTEALEKELTLQGLGGSRNGVEPGTSSVAEQNTAQALVVALMSRMKYLEDERVSRARKIGELTECVETQIKQIGQFKQAAVDLQKHLEGREEHFQQVIQTIEDSRAWRFVTKLRRIRFWFCPSGSRRERVYRYVIGKLGF